MTIKECVNQNQFSIFCEVARSSINLAVKNGHVVLNKDQKVDLNDPINNKYLKKHREKADAGKQNVRRTTAIVPLKDTNSDTTGFVVSVNAKAELEMLKLQADIDLKHLKLATERGYLVNRSTLGKWVITHLDTLHKKLLGLGTQIVDPIIALSTTEGGRGAVIDLMNKTISAHLSHTRDEMIRMLGDEKNQ